MGNPDEEETALDIPTSGDAVEEEDENETEVDFKLLDNGEDDGGKSGGGYGNNNNFSGRTGGKFFMTLSMPGGMSVCLLVRVCVCLCV